MFDLNIAVQHCRSLVLSTIRATLLTYMYVHAFDKQRITITREVFFCDREEVFFCDREVEYKSCRRRGNEPEEERVSRVYYEYSGCGSIDSRMQSST